jgi:hypothetical protein
MAVEAVAPKRDRQSSTAQALWASRGSAGSWEEEEEVEV